MEYCLDVEKLNLSAIRTVRVLRPLRAINRIPSKSHESHLRRKLNPWPRHENSRDAAAGHAAHAW